MAESIREKFYAVCSRDLNMDISKIDPDSDFRTQVSIDSMQYVELYAALVYELNIDIPSDLMEAKTINQMIALIEKAAGGQA